jgi:hypothetical protein
MRANNMLGLPQVTRCPATAPRFLASFFMNRAQYSAPDTNVRKFVRMINVFVSLSWSLIKVHIVNLGS